MMYSFQSLFMIMFDLSTYCDDLVSKLYKCIDVIKRNAGYRNAINHELITKTMLSSICLFCDF